MVFTDAERLEQAIYIISMHKSKNNTENVAELNTNLQHSEILSC